jgi:hypothetical protein
MREFSMSAMDVMSTDKLRDTLGYHGVYGPKKQMESIMSYIIASAKNLQHSTEVEIMRTQFGWADKDSKFSIGEQEVSADKVAYSPPSSATGSLAEWLKPTGDYEEWKKSVHIYNEPGFEPHAFGFFTAFGAPLLKFTGQKGAIINLVFRGSGSGKSTTLAVCNSVWGHPDNLMCIPKDTVNAKMLKLGVMNNLPFTMDEITNMVAEEFSDMSYGMSQGRWKDRSMAATNELRLNTTFWQTISLCSANAHFAQKLASLKATPDGEMMRLMEYQIGYSDAIDVAEGKQYFDHQLRENYGVAGGIYAQWLVGNKEEAVQTMRAIQAKIDKELKLTQRERFWSAVVACNITGGLIARNLGLIDYDMKAIYKWATDLIKELRKEGSAPMDDASTVLGDFLNRHVDQCLVVNGEADSRTNLSPAPLREPRGALVARYEPDTKKLYIQSSAFKDDCVKKQIGYSDVLREMKLKGVFIGRVTRRLGTGMKMVTAPVYVLEFDCTNPEYLNVEAFVPVEKPDAGGEGQLPNQLASV